MEIGYVGLGNMGINMAKRLMAAGHKVVAFNRGEEGRDRGRKAGLDVRGSLAEMIAGLSPKRKIVWLMVSHTGVDEMLKNILPLLKTSDILIDGGNSFYEDTLRRAKLVESKGVRYVDAGVSGGPGGAASGACIMVGGDKKIFNIIKPIVKDAAAPRAFQYLGSVGAGHFAKMVHNGIEYGMMQAIAEGFDILRKSSFGFNMKELAELYNNRSVIESRLVGWLRDGLKKYGGDLDLISGVVAHTGEGEWTVKTARKLGAPAKIISESFNFRKKSAKKGDSYQGRVLMAMRNQFGGHSIK